MSPYRISLSSFFIFLITFSFGQNFQRKYLAHSIHEGDLEISVNDGKYIIRSYNKHILETSFIPEGQVLDPYSHAVILDAEKQEFELTEDKNLMVWSSSGLRLEIQKEPFEISYSYKDNFLLAEAGGYAKTDTSEQLEFRIRPDEALYGGGARALGMNRRGNLLPLYNKAHYGYETLSKQMNYSIPIVLSSRMYMLHFDNAPIGYLDLDSKGNNTLSYSTISGRKTYQVIGGETWPEIMDHYTQLTGRQPLPPRWAFGNFSSRFGYHSEKETRETVDLFLKDSIPLDAVVIDIYWFGADIKGHMGNLEFLTDSFPTPYKMMADFEEKGIKTILVTEPFILTTSKRWKEAKKKKVLAKNKKGKPYKYDFYFGNTGIVDIYDSTANAWFWNIYKELTEKGVGGWWGDLGEPEVHPSDLIHATGTADEVHNIYGHDWARLIYEGYQKDFPDQRPFILMRAGYSGSQRFGLIPWSGDVSRSWGGLASQTEIALQMGMQGLGYMHSDLGGFAEGKVFDPKLYTRWLQYGIFQPLFRPHAQEHIAAEPVFHDSTTKALAKEAIQLRYRLLPYNYSLAFENNQSGMPMMRPILFEEPENSISFDMSDSYLWGDAFLVSPVTDSLQVKKEIYFPKTANWFDFYSDIIYRGGQTYAIDLSEDHIPVFVRGGSFIPMVKVVQSTLHYSTKNLDLIFYFDSLCSSSNFSLYDDDGITPGAYQKGKYELLECSSNHDDRILEINLVSSAGNNYEATDRSINLIIKKMNKKPERITAGGHQTDFTWNAQTESVEIRLNLHGNSSVLIHIER